MSGDGAMVTALKQKLYLGRITAGEFADQIAPIRLKHGWIFDFWNVHWLYYTQILLLVTGGLIVILSLLTPAPDPKTRRFTWYGATAEEKAATRASWNRWDVILSCIVVLIVAVFYAVFW
jgi:SSS family solute:Na+ symporter